MRVISPFEVAEAAGGNKYLGVLIAARYARELNALPLGQSPYGPDKLTTRSIEELTSGQIEFRLVKRRRQQAP
jgi:DNA-directed RNA polymerase subunit K/omega